MRKQYRIKVNSYRPLHTSGSDKRNLTLEDLKKSELGKAMEKLFEVGFVNTQGKHNTLESIYTNNRTGWPTWNEIIFGEERCKLIFYLSYSSVKVENTPTTIHQYVDVDYMVKMDKYE